MEITIENLMPACGRLRAEFACTLGRAIGIWHGERLPVPFRAQVEIDIDDHAAIAPAGVPARYAIGCSGNVSRVTGQVDSTGDGMLCVRVGNDVLQLDVPQAARFRRGDWIRIETTELHVYPFSL